MQKAITIVHMKDLVSYPPVLSLIENLLANGHKVRLISYGIERAPESILQHSNLRYYSIPEETGKGPIAKFKREAARKKLCNQYTLQFMENADILWTTTDISVRTIPELCEKYKNIHVMQLMELEEWYPRIVGINLLKFPIDYYARNAYKVVVPEINRAHILQTWWRLDNTPCVLPNKPYSINPSFNEKVEIAIKKMKAETKKIILYLGIVAKDRNIDCFVDALTELGNEYCIYVAGRIDNEMRSEFQGSINEGKVVYLGNFPAPSHLKLLEQAHIGLVPYYLNERHQFISPLNVQYCAPNKIFEYSAYGVPMLGTNVMGLVEPFSKFGIGVCCSKLDKPHIVKAIRQIEAEHEAMSNNCKRFFESVDLDQIVKDIIS